jgi:hypothetical protein
VIIVAKATWSIGCKIHGSRLASEMIRLKSFTRVDESSSLRADDQEKSVILKMSVRALRQSAGTLHRTIASAQKIER